MPIYPIAKILLALLLITALLEATSAQAQRRLEKLNRGVVAVRTGPSAVYVGWRLFGTDPAGLAFNVYRDAIRLNATPVSGATNYVDNTAATGNYTVRPVLNGVEQAPSEAASPWSQQFMRIPITPPPVAPMPAGPTPTRPTMPAWAM